MDDAEGWEFSLRLLQSVEDIFFDPFAAWRGDVETGERIDPRTVFSGNRRDRRMSVFLCPNRIRLGRQAGKNVRCFEKRIDDPFFCHTDGTCHLNMCFFKGP